MDKDLKEVILSSERALRTSKLEWHAYPYEREVPDHHIRWQKSIDRMREFLDQGLSLQDWLSSK